MMTWVGDALILLGALILFIAAYGLFVLKDALSRQHAATNAGAFGLGLIMAGVAAVGGDWPWTWRSVAVVLAVWATMPVASQFMARAALREQLKAKAMPVTPLYRRDEPEPPKAS